MAIESRFSTKKPPPSSTPPSGGSGTTSSTRGTCPPGKKEYQAKSPTGETVTFFGSSLSDAKRQYEAKYNKPAFQIGTTISRPPDYKPKSKDEVPETPDKDRPSPPADLHPGIEEEPSEPTPKEPVPVMSRLEASREWVRQFGHIPKSGSPGIAGYRAGVEAIQHGETPVKGYGTKVGIYEVQTNRGTKKFEAINADQAIRKAESYGLDVSGTAKKVGEQKLTIPQAYERIRTAEKRGKMQGALALLTYGGIVPKDQRPAEDAIPVRGQEGVYFIDKGLADELRDTEAYAKAKGNDLVKMGIALSITQKDFTNWLNRLKSKSPELYKVYQDKGYDGLIEVFEVNEKQRQAVLDKLSNYKVQGGYNITAALLDGAIKPHDLSKAGFEEKDIDDAAMSAIATSPRLIRDVLPQSEWQGLAKEFKTLPEDKQGWYMKERNAFAQYIPDSPLIKGSFDKLSNWNKKLVLEWYYTNRPEYFRERAKATGYVALAFVPVAGTIAYWKTMSPAMRALSIAGDVLLFIPLLKGAAAGARAAKGYTAGVKTKAAIVGAGQMALAELTAPADFLAHPVVVTKSLGRQFKSAIDTIFHPKKIPLGAAEISYSTVRLPTKDVGGAKQAMALRDAAVKSTIQGKSTTATVGGVTLDLNRTQLQKVGGAMAIHNTPDIRPYINGAVVRGGKEGSGLFLAPNFHSRFAYATAFGDVPEGGVKGGLIIRDQRALNALSPSGKLYRGAAEIEAILKPGTILPAPTQVLFTNDIAGNKFTFLVLGKPFTPAQVAKLKLLGSLDTMIEIFRPTIRLSKAQRAVVGAMDDIIELAGERARLTRQLDAARSAGKITQVTTIRQQLTDIDNRIAGLTERVNTLRATVRPTDIVWGQYADKGVLERWRELHPKEVQRTALGRRLYGIEPARIARAINTPEVARRFPARGSKEAGYRVPPVERRTPTIYAPVSTPPYVPPYVPKYAPPYIPPFVPPYVPPRVPTHAPSKQQPPARTVTTGAGKKVRKVPPGSITWRQGRVWKYIKPPWKQEKPITLREPPEGAVRIGEKTPEKTIQMIGKSKAKVPKTVSVDLGVVDILIKKYGKFISFTGKGLETVAGGSIAGTTKGMSIPATSPRKVKGYSQLAFGTSTRSLTSETYNKDIPKKFADKILSQHLGKMSSKEIATELRDSKVSDSRKAEILKMLPDRVKAQVELWLTISLEYVPTRGMPKARRVPTIFRRKRQRRRKVVSDSELSQSASSMR